MSRKEIIDILEFIDEERNKGVSVDSEILYGKFEKSLVKKSVQWGLAEFSGTDYYLTEKGYNALNQGQISKNTKLLGDSILNFQKSSSKHSKEIINETKELTKTIKEFSLSSDKSNKSINKLTIAMLILAFVNLVLFSYQIYLTIQQIPPKPNIEFLPGGREIKNGSFFINPHLDGGIYRIIAQDKIEPDKEYISNLVFITNKGKTTEGLSLLIGCNFKVVGINQMGFESSPTVKFKSAFEIVKPVLEIEKIALSDFVFLELIQDGEVDNPQCEFIYSSADIDEGEEKISWA